MNNNSNYSGIHKTLLDERQGITSELWCEQDCNSRFTSGLNDSGVVDFELDTREKITSLLSTLTLNLLLQNSEVCN